MTKRLRDGFGPCAMWPSIIESAALRRDALVFAQLILARSTYAAIAATTNTWPQVKYRYWARFFEEIGVENDTVLFLRNGDLHRTDGPAYEESNGTKKWFINNELHRTDGPAVEWAFGRGADGAVGSGEEWHVDGYCHRVDGPAIIWSDGTKMWFLNGEMQRIDGPAI